MKRCGRCGEWKAIDDFGIKEKAKGTRQSFCRICARHYRNAYNERFGKEALHARIQAHTARYRLINRRFLDAYLETHPCVDCGEKDIVVLEFDHVRGKKLAAVSVMMQGAYSIKRLSAEVDKCDVRCANCHRRRTAATRWKLRQRSRAATEQELAPSAVRERTSKQGLLPIKAD